MGLLSCEARRRCASAQACGSSGPDVDSSLALRVQWSVGRLPHHGVKSCQWSGASASCPCAARGVTKLGRELPAGIQIFSTCENLRVGRRVWVLLGDSDAAAAAQAAAADALAAAAADAPEPGDSSPVVELPASMAAAAGILVAGSSASGSRGCPLYAKFHDKAYPHSQPPAMMA